MARSYPNPPGPPPKADSRRRRRNKPASYGEAKPTTATAAAPTADRKLGIDGAHPLVAALWDAVQKSCEATFYSEADWQRLRLELWFANRTIASDRQPRPPGRQYRPGSTSCCCRRR